MEHTTEELLLALAVRERMKSLRNAKAKNMTDAEYKQFCSRPDDDLFQEVMEEANTLASMIKRMRGS